MFVQTEKPWNPFRDLKHNTVDVHFAIGVMRGGRTLGVYLERERERDRNWL